MAGRADVPAAACGSPDESRLRLDPSICDQPSPRDRYTVQVGDAAWLIELQSTRGADMTLRELPL